MLGQTRMNILDRIREVFTGVASERLFATPTEDSLFFVLSATTPDDEHWEVGSPLAVHVLNELAISELAIEQGDGFHIRWDNLYAALNETERGATLTALGLPTIGHLRPRLRSANSLDDSDFEIAIEGWLNAEGRTDASKVGAIARTDKGLELMPHASYELTQGVSEFWKHPIRTAESNRFHWGRIRTLAVRANAGLDQFLADTIVLTPDKLQIKLLDADIAGSSVVEVQPWFAGAPDTWLDHFDRSTTVKDRYQIVTEQGLVEVLIAPQVKSVLSAIKAMPGRRMAGAAAERFIHNPFAALGPDAIEVLDEAQFDRARHEAGIDFERFVARIHMSGDEVQEVGVVVERMSERNGESAYERFNSLADLRAFIARVESKLQTGFQLCEWRHHRLELTGDAANELSLLKTAYIEWSKPRVSIKAVDVLDLKRYSERISGIGIQPRVVSPYIPVQSGSDPWFPEPPISVESSVAVSVPIGSDRDFELVVDSKVYETVKRAAVEADASGKETISIPGHPDAIPVGAAKAIVEQLQTRFGELGKREIAADETKSKKAPDSKQRKELLLRANIAQPEFAEERAKELQLAANAAPRLPASLKPTIALYEHQLSGVAWLQNLFNKAPDQCRGAVLADDMGLGKTIQLLALICRAIEESPTLDPVLIVAPVSLLENWKEEVETFFGSQRPRILTLYGSALDGLRAPRHAIEQELIDQGIARFLMPGWRGNAQLVLTTYETLRDLEFSLAAVRWSLMVCDEAQKIKNPAAMVTRAAKKQNVRFRIACTGTPVENSLADLWCLFDFVQPGLLGSLNEFGATYRRPIECETEEQKERVGQLRALIEPQILRRTKKDVAKDLPPKIVVSDPDPRKLRMSDHQRALYGNALEQFKLRRDPSRSSPFKNHLGLLHYLRRLCIAPEPDARSSSSEPLGSYRRKNPKIDWLIVTLHQIKLSGEKVIVFCEFRETQVLLAQYIEQEFHFRPDIINGDTEASASAADSRQKRITRFQEQSGFGVIILSPIAVGYGVNIQAANHVVHFSRTWNPAKEDQATDRAYRIKQTKPVYVYYPVVCADDFTTFDVKLDRLLDRKRSLSDDMLNGCGDLSPAEFAEIVEIDDRVFDERINLEEATKLDPLEFEALIAALWKKQGFRTVELTPRTGDAGIDVIAKTVSVGELIQCKSSRSDGTRLSWEAIKDVVTGEAKYRFDHPGVVFTKVAATNQFFNENAHYHAGLNHVRLIDQAVLSKLLEQHRIVRGDIEALLTSRVHVRIDLPSSR
jgi:phage host-nuclease inhibitor protein Gam